MTVFLNVNDGTIIKSYELKDTLTIGRSHKNDIVVDNERVSAFHGRFYCVGKLVFYKDLKSKNGTFINDKKIELCRLFSEDIVKIENYIITLDVSKLTEEQFSKIFKL